MIKQLLTIGFLIFSIGSANAKNLLAIKFELIQDKKILERGNTFVAQKKSTWKKGHTQRYIKLNCHQLPSGIIEKKITSEDHFTGLRVSHQIVEEYVELKVDRNIVNSRLKEIRALNKNDCKNLAPIMTKTSKTYLFPAKPGIDETRLFNNNLKFRIMIRSIRGAR